MHNDRTPRACAGGGRGRISAISRKISWNIYRGMATSAIWKTTLLRRAALVVECDDPLGRARQVGDDEADARIKLARVPLDFGDHPAQLGPGSCLIGEIGMET